MTFINNISNSRGDVIDQCLLKYKYRYVDRFPGFGNKNQDALNFGSFIHKIFEDGYKLKDMKSLLKIAESERPTYKVPFTDNERMKSCLEHFLVWNSKLGETISAEMSVSVPLDQKNDITFIGIIDRVVKGTDGGYLVIDYKTSKREKKKATLMDDNQLKGYAYAIHTMYDVPYDQIYCSHYYPVTGNFVSVKFSKWQVEKWKKKQIEKVWMIRKKKKDEFWANQNVFCDYCEFQPICHKFNTEAQVCVRLEEQTALKKKLAEDKKLLESKKAK
jgi:hypothetical protein